MNLDDILPLLKNVANHNGQYQAQCPVHDDKTASLSLKEEGGKVLIHCHAGCTFQAVMDALGIKKPDGKTKPVISAVYDYRFADGSLNFQVCRMVPKNFRQRRNETDWTVKGCPVTPFRLELWHSNGKAVFIPEGEKDCLGLESLGFTATCNAGGAGKWRPDHAAYLKDRICFILPDNDRVGQEHGQQVAKSLQGIAKETRIVNLPDLPAKGDVSDFIQQRKAAGKTDAEIRAEIETHVKAAPVCEVETTPKNNVSAEKIQVMLPGNGKLISEFAKECFSIIAEKKEVFIYSDSICRIATTQKKDAKTEKMRDIVAFKHITSCSLVTELEKHLIPAALVKNKDTGGYEQMPRSIDGQLSRVLCECSERERLPVINLITSISLPYFDENEICLSDPGYDAKQGLWTDTSCPKVETIPLEDAISSLYELFSEFCFLEPGIDLSRAITYLLTPMLKLIVGDCRAQIFYVSGNRPGVGKDLLLGLAPVLFTGRDPYFASPCKDDDEYRKLIFSACMEGSEFLLISNVSGHLKSDPIEQGATSIHLAGRVLGKSENKRLLNNGIWGISGNGLSLSEDLVRRCLEIRLEKYEEDITQQEFKHSDLYCYALENREKILSALLTLIVNWKAKGAPPGTSIRSFVKWSQATSGILTAAGLPCPFIQRQKLTPSMALGGNRDTGNLKSLVEAWYAGHGISNVKADDLRRICDEYSLFNWLEMDTRSGIVKFTKLLTRFAEREFSGLKIHIEDNAKTKTYYLEKVMS